MLLYPLGPLMFAGTHAISSRIFGLMPERDIFSIVDHVYAPLLTNETIAGVVDDNARWFDIGTPQRYLAANRALCGTGSVVWDDCHIAPGVELIDCIVTYGVTIRRPMRLENTIVCRDETSIPPSSAWRREEGLVFASF